MSSGHESPIAKAKHRLANCWASTVSCSKNTKETALIKQLELSVAGRKKKFGVDYLNLRAGNASPQDLQKCVEAAEADIAVLVDQIQEHEKAIGANKEELNRKLGKTGTPQSMEPAAAAGATAGTTDSPAAGTATVSTAPEAATTTTTTAATAPAEAPTNATSTGAYVPQSVAASTTTTTTAQSTSNAATNNTTLTEAHETKLPPIE